MPKPLQFFIGSLPYEKPNEAIQFVKRFSSHLPFLPQLPEANPMEDMVGQVLRGIDLGFWDDKASSCLELFQNEFVDSTRFKIQIAGPYTVSRSMSSKFTDIAPLWVSFWAGLRKQLKEASFQGELWLQLDEPFWSKEAGYMADGYTAFLQAIRETGENLKLGIHSCATHRPEIFPDHLQLVDFFSFDFLRQPMTPEEENTWFHLLNDKGKILIFGGLSSADGAKYPAKLEEHPNFWVSSPCGFYGWDIKDLEQQVLKWQKL
ncbi:MAG: hypothetical protein EBR01_06025 [Proteobacteria bacterium]|nr:hypothetical protein [Pseudomonadota bacterium]NBY18890.1 hypothetical protein [bacterium]